jgi:hypothetical protein
MLSRASLVSSIFVDDPPRIDRVSGLWNQTIDMTILENVVVACLCYLRYQSGELVQGLPEWD